MASDPPPPFPQCGTSIMSPLWSLEFGSILKWLLEFWRVYGLRAIIFFLGAKFVFLLYSRGIMMNCCDLAFVAELYADNMTLFWDFCFVAGCFFSINISHGCY